MQTTDYLVLLSFLLITLIIGACAGRGIKDMELYAVGGRSYTTFPIFATLSASYIGGGYTFGLSEKSFTYGMSYGLCLLGVSLQLFIVAQYIAPRMSRFCDAYSTGDIMAQFYGTTGRLITGFASVIVCAGIIGAQVKATGFVFNLFLNIDPIYGTIIGCGIVVIYSIYGGMKAVVATDILQFAVLIIAIPLTLILGINYIGGIDKFVGLIPNTHLELPGKLGWPTMISVFLSLFLGEALVPPYVQRLFLSKDVKITQRATLISSIMSVPFFLVGTFIGLLALSLNNNLDSNMSLPYVINVVLPIGIKGLAAAGIIACIMSSADSYLNSAAIAIVHDIIKPISKKNLSSQKQLGLTRISTFIIGVLAIIFAILIESAIDILLYSYNFWSPIILVPLVLGILGVQISVSGFVISAVASCISVILWNMFISEHTGVDGLVIGVLANFIIFTFYSIFDKNQIN